MKKSNGDHQGKGFSCENANWNARSFSLSQILLHAAMVLEANLPRKLSARNMSHNLVSFFIKHTMINFKHLIRSFYALC
jgi:hypothetical protein